MRTNNTKPSAPGKSLPSADGLINIAAKAGQQAYQASREPEAYRIAGRVNRLIQFQISDLTEQEATALAEAHVHLAKAGTDAFPDEPYGFFLLQSAIAQVSYSLWEDLWNDMHPDRHGKAWDGQDFALMSVWREKVRAMIKECRQDAILAMTDEEYVARLIEAGAGEETAEGLADWRSEVIYQYGGTTGPC